MEFFFSFTIFRENLTWRVCSWSDGLSMSIWSMKHGIKSWYRSVVFIGWYWKPCYKHWPKGADQLFNRMENWLRKFLVEEMCVSCPLLFFQLKSLFFFNPANLRSPMFSWKFLFFSLFFNFVVKCKICIFSPRDLQDLSWWRLSGNTSSNAAVLILASIIFLKLGFSFSSSFIKIGNQISYFKFLSRLQKIVSKTFHARSRATA